MNDHRHDDLCATDELLGEAEALIWALLDDQLDEPSAQRLAAMMEHNAAIRARYVDCVQLHVDLCEHFGRPTLAAPQPARPVVLPNLLEGLPGSHELPQRIE